MDFNFIFSSLKIALGLLGSFWWLYLPFILAAGFLKAWGFYTQERYLDSLEWVLLHIKPPTDTDRSPKGTEQFFVGLHGVFVSALGWKDKFFGGKVPDWFSLEIVGSERGTNFYLYTLRQHRGLVESSLFAQYPGTEIKEVEDYMEKWPAHLPNEEMDLFGTELLLTRENPYPLRTYEYFEEKAADLKSIKRIDPLSIVSETFSTLRSGEFFVIQLLISPIGHDWIKTGETIINKIASKETKTPEPDLLERAMRSVDQILLGPQVVAKKEEKRERMLLPPEEEAIKGIRKKISKLGFQSSVRLVYLARKDAYHRYHFSAISGAFRQFADLNLNSFKVNRQSLTFFKGYGKIFFPSDRGFLAEQVTWERKWKIYRNLRARVLPEQNMILNTEELATIFHLPGWLEVQAPMFSRVEAKKGQPPVNLPTE